jgi:5-methylcytosine-specific restriction endonuclease McrBC regulatory subunit McrC
MLHPLLSILNEFGIKYIKETNQYLLEILEHRSLSTALPPHLIANILDDAYKLFEPAIRMGLISIETKRVPSLNTLLVISTTSVVGFVSCRDIDGICIFLKVNPKVGTTRMLELAVLAGMLPKWKQGGAHLSQSLENSLLEWMIGAFEDSIRDLLSHGGLRNTHERIQAELVNKVRGRVRISPWLRNVVRGRAHIVPCEFPSLEFDNRINRFIRWAIHVAITAAQRIPDAGDIATRLLKCDQQFAGASLVKPNVTSVDHQPLPSNFRHYAQAMNLARFIMNSIELGTNAGQIEAMSIAFDMNKIYERAFFNGLHRIVDTASQQEEWSITFTQSSEAKDLHNFKRTRMIPDVWVAGNSERLPIVIDTKWKKGFGGVEHIENVGNQSSTSKIPAAGLRLHPDDLYQATAYALEVINRAAANQEHIDGCLSVLIYPTTTPTDDLEREITVGYVRILIRLVAWNVSAPPDKEISDIWARLSLAAGGIKSHAHSDTSRSL